MAARSAYPPSRLRVTGFTLLELMVVVGLVGVMAALAAPSMTTTLQRERTREDAAEVRSALLRLRSWARSTRTCVWVTVASNTITGEQRNAGTGETCTSTATGESRSFAIDLGLTVGAFDTVSGGVEFNKDGGANLSTVATMPLTGQVSRQLRVWPYTGLVTEGR